MVSQEKDKDRGGKEEAPQDDIQQHEDEYLLMMRWNYFYVGDPGIKAEYY